MKILADENIPFAEELFGTLGDVTLTAGREVDEGFPGLPEFDVLAIRSVTEVTPALVDRAVSLKVLATATIGTDHINVRYIREANSGRESPIEVLSAPGSNADSVADYVWRAIAHLTRTASRPLSEMSLGIIGHGNCGSRVARRAVGFGVRVLRHDPPLEQRDASFASDPLAVVLQADVVTLHVPLTRAHESDYPTYHMIGAGEMGRMGREAFLLNTSRGAVVESGALAAALREGAIAGAALDVYEGEPTPAPELVEMSALATPHIAGYAVEAKRRGATAIYEQTCRVLGAEPMDTTPLLLGGFRAPSRALVCFEDAGSVAMTADGAVRALLSAIYDIEVTSKQLKQTVRSDRRGELFDAMRRDYEGACGCHELSVYRVAFGGSVPDELRRAAETRLSGFGITVDGESPHYVLAFA